MKKTILGFIISLCFFILIPATLVQAKSWRDAYKDYLNNNDHYSEQLIYLDNDKIPELITTEGVFSYKKGKIIECLSEDIIDIQYVPKKGILLVSTPGVGSDLKYYKMDSKTKKMKQIAHIVSWYEGASSNVGKFYFNNREISENKFDQYIDEYGTKYKTKYVPWQYGTMIEGYIDYDKVYEIPALAISKFEKNSGRLIVNAQEITCYDLYGNGSFERIPKTKISLKLSNKVKYLKNTTKISKTSFSQIKSFINNASYMSRYPEYISIGVKGGKVVKVEAMQ